MNLEIKSGTRLLGRIEFYNPTKGFGFVSGPNKNEPDYFFHVSDVHGVPQIGRTATFEPGERSKGKIALNVEIVGGAR